MHTTIWFWNTVGNTEIVFFALKYYQTAYNASILPPKNAHIASVLKYCQGYSNAFYLKHCKNAQNAYIFWNIAKKPIMCALKYCHGTHSASISKYYLNAHKVSILNIAEMSIGPVQNTLNTSKLKYCQNILPQS